MDSIYLVSIIEDCGIERTTKHPTKVIGVDARNCKVPEVYSYSNDFVRYWLWYNVLVAKLS